MTTYRPRPLDYAQIGPSERTISARLARHPDDKIARLAARALATARALHERAEAEEDAAALDAYEATRDQESIPSKVVDQLTTPGAGKLRIWRRHRGYTLAVLADLSGLSIGYISEIERGAKDGSLTALRKLAAALDLDLDDLV